MTHEESVRELLFQNDIFEEMLISGWLLDE